MARRFRRYAKKEPTGTPVERANRTTLSRTLILMILCGVVLFIPLISVLYNLMIVEHDKYEEMAIHNQTRSMVLTADRGVIYDRNMNIMASSSTVETIFLDPNAISKAEEEEEQKRLEGDEDYNPDRSAIYIAKGLSEILDVDMDTIRELAADTKYYYKVVKRKVPEETAQKVRNFINEHELTGLVNLEMDSQRYYPYGSLAGQLMGFVRTDNVGAEGLEAYYDATLTGNAGAIITTKGNQNSEMLYTYEKYYDAADGNSLVLTLDVTVQYYLEKNLEEAMARYDVKNGAFGVVMDVNTGEILGMATLGSYDPNNYQEIYDEELSLQLEQQYQQALLMGKETQAYTDSMAAYNAAIASARLRQWRNRCVSDGYEPGSTFKLITLSAALDSGAVTENNSFVCNGTGHVYANRDQPVDCWKLVGHGTLTTKEALGASCNPSFATMGVLMGDKTFYNYIKNYGFLERTGVDLPGEATGLFFSEADFCGVSQASMISTTFGQTFKITPIQLARAVAAVVNGGYLLEPYIVGEVMDAEGNTVTKNEPTVLRQVISEETSATMREMMEYVVTDGTASKAKVPGYRVGGKTGTSEKMDVFDEFGKLVDDKICSFVGVAPINDPQYVVLVALDTPSKESNAMIGGGAMAAPTVAAIMSDVLPYLGIDPVYTEEDLNLIEYSMPDLIGLTEAEAKIELDKKNLTYRVVGEGATIMDQLPAAGASIPGKSEVVLYFNQSAPTDLVTVPDFLTYNLNNANYLATTNGLYMLITGANKHDPNVTATYQDIPAGTQVPRGTMVTVEFTDYSAGE
ncbi:MAG: PASTA domain-containing protein [Oscillospiraceae bacterium]|nr:PASTA domain-containing protein [Oscillospiraceae bacterium]